MSLESLFLLFLLQPVPQSQNSPSCLQKLKEKRNAFFGGSKGMGFSDTHLISHVFNHTCFAPGAHCQ